MATVRRSLQWFRLGTVDRTNKMKFTEISLWTLPLGALAAAVIIIGLMLWQKRERRRRGERPPQPEKLLRLPGHTLALKLTEADQKEEKAMVTAIFTGAGLALLVSVVVQLFWNDGMRRWMTANGGLSAFLRPNVWPMVLSATLLLV